MSTEFGFETQLIACITYCSAGAEGWGRIVCYRYIAPLERNRKNGTRSVPTTLATFPLQTSRLPQSRFHQIHNSCIHTIPLALRETEGIKDDSVKGATVF